MKSTFGTLIREGRKAKGMLQSDLIEKLAEKGLEIKQPTLSSWEKNRYPRSNDKDKCLTILADVLEIDKDILNEAYKKASADNSNPDFRLDINIGRLIKDVGHILNTFRHENCEIWFVGSESLPILREPVFETLWIDNINKGVSYNIILFIDDAENDKVKNFFHKIEKIKNNDIFLSSVKGSINIYPVSSLKKQNAEKKLNYIIDIYREKNEDFKNYEFIILNDIFFNWHESESHNSIMAIWQKFSTITMYFSKRKSDRAYANINLLNVSRKYNFNIDINKEESIDPYFWFDAIKSHEFHMSIESFKESYEKYKSKNK